MAKEPVKIPKGQKKPPHPLLPPSPKNTRDGDVSPRKNYREPPCTCACVRDKDTGIIVAACLGHSDYARDFKHPRWLRQQIFARGLIVGFAAGALSALVVFLLVWVPQHG